MLGMFKSLIEADRISVFSLPFEYDIIKSSDWYIITATLTAFFSLLFLAYCLFLVASFCEYKQLAHIIICRSKCTPIESNICQGETLMLVK